MAKFKPPEEKADYLQSLAKGLAVIEAFGTDYPEMTLSVVARRVGLSPGSTRRVLQTLVQLGFMGFKDQRYHLSAKTLQLGYSYLSSLPVVSLMQPRLAALSEKLNESCSIVVLDGLDTVCIARVAARRLERDYMGVGTRFPAHATSSGKMLFAEMTDDEVSALFGGQCDAAGADAIHRHETGDAARRCAQSAPERLGAYQPGDSAGPGIDFRANPHGWRAALCALGQRPGFVRRTDDCRTLSAGCNRDGE